MIVLIALSIPQNSLVLLIRIVMTLSIIIMKIKIMINVAWCEISAYVSNLMRAT